MRNTIARYTAIACLLVGLAATTTAAHAAPIQPGRGSERHCLVHLDAIQPGEQFSRMSKLQCFATPAEVTASIAQRNAQAAIAGTGIQAILIGTDYTDPNYAGSSMNWTAPTGCYYNGTQPSYGAASMPAGWDNVISSSRTYSGCRASLVYDFTNFGGLSMAASCNAATLSFMDNRASSREWTDQTYGYPC